jgi:molecular chaperone GrpE
MPKKPTIQSLHEQVDELTDALQRSHAELVNYKRRTDEERVILMQTAKASVVKDLLSVIDNLERATKHQPKELKDNAWAQGINGVAKQLEESLSKMGVTKIDAKPGTPFDPILHEAVMMEEGEGEQEVIAEEMQPGYQIGDNIIRHAMVKVTTS